MDAVTSPVVDLAFLCGDGELGHLIASFDWSRTSLGPIASWPDVVKTTLALITRSPVPIVTLWGEQGVMVYNDAYAEFAGGRHPDILGANVLEGWPEAAEWNRKVMQAVFHRGETLSVQDLELTLHRHDVGEPVWMNLDYSPILNQDGTIAGVIAIVVETTGKVRAERQLTGERQQLRRMFDQAPGFMALLEGSKHVFAMANRAYLDLVGGREIIGKTVAQALPEVAEQGFVELLDQVYQSREPFVGHAVPVTLRRDTDEEQRFVDFIFQPLTADDGSVTSIFVQGQDVTGQQNANRALRESEERFRRIFEQASDLILTADLDQVITDCNPAAAAAVGLSREAAIGRRISDFISPDDYQRTTEMLSTKLHGGGTTQYDVRVRSSSGEWLFWEINSGLTFDDAGKPMGLHVVGRDVTERKRFERHQQLLVGELNHRVKNTLAIVQSLAHQSFHSGMPPSESILRFQGRLEALARAHNLLTNRSWEAASIREVTQAALAAFCSPDRCHSEGPELALPPQTAVSLALALHELATNASKYGALSNATGKVAVNWQLVGEQLEFTWAESGGPPVTVPQSRGFGTRMIERTLASEFGGSVEFDFKPEGVTCTVIAPIPQPQS